MRHFLVYFIIISSTFMACKYECSDAEANISLVSYESAETDTIIVRKFAKNSSFTSLLDTFLLNRSTSSYRDMNDTLEIFSSFGTDHGIVSRYDYEIYLPAINILYQVSEIVEDYQSMNQGLSCNKPGCLNRFISYKVNGQVTIANSYYTLFFKK